MLKLALITAERLSVFVVELAAIKYDKFAVTAVEGKIRSLSSGMRSSDHRSTALWTKHMRPPAQINSDFFYFSKYIGIFP